MIPPIYATSTYKQDGVGGLRGGYEYSRSANPTRTALEECMAALEEGERGFAFASGLAAEDTLLARCAGRATTCSSPTTRTAAAGGCSPGSRSLGAARTTRHRSSDLDAVRAAIRPGETKVVWLETPTNPMLNIGDIEALAGIAHEAGAMLVVDNTFASPYLQQPLALGADVVVHSTTKYVGGHSDVVGGAVVVRDLELAEQIGFHQNAIGAVAGPFDALLMLRGLKTLAVRMERHCDNAEAVVEFLDPPRGRGRGRTTRAWPSTRATTVAARQMKRFGGIVSFRVAGGEQHAVDVCGTAEVLTLGESLGGVESLIEHPGRMTHASVAGTDARGARRPDPALRRHRDDRRPARRPRPGPRLRAESAGRDDFVCVDFGSTFTKAALVAWPRACSSPQAVAPDDDRHRRPRRARRVPGRPRAGPAGPTPRCWPARQRRRRAADRGRRQRGAGHRRGRPPGRAVQRRPGGRVVAGGRGLTDALRAGDTTGRTSCC